MKVVELILDDEQENFIEAISVVEHPAIEEDFVALKNEQKEYTFAKQDEEKRLLVGAILTPNKPIFRRNAEEDYYIYFSRDTVRKASQLYLKKGFQASATLEHEAKINGLTLVESWIVDDPKMDKTNLYGMDLPKGTWAGAIKVDNDDIWNNFVKTGKVKGFSIEGYFVDKADVRDENEDLATELLNELKQALEGVKLETFNDYPEAAVNNAKRAIKYKEEKGTNCGTTIGWTRAGQLSRKEKVSRSVIARMASFKRHEQNKDVPYDEGCGGIMWDAWGGSAGVEWAIRKLKQIDKESLEYIPVDENYAIINDRLAYSTKEQAEKIAEDIGCEGYHVHKEDDKEWFMPCKQHALAEVGERGGIRKSPKAPAGDTPNKNPKGQGTAKGDASGARGAKVSKKDEATLKKKADDFNKRYKDKLGYGVTVGQLKSVYQRGLGAFNVSHSPAVKSASQWAFARVNAYMYLVKNGRPESAKYITDYDLLPKKHPKSTRK